MKPSRILPLMLMILLIVSCSTPKQINYFQDLQPGVSELSVANPIEIRIRPKDKLSIIINTQDQKLNELFNLRNVQGNNSSNNIQLGYTVDNEGCINLPILGNISVKGLTRQQVVSHIIEQLQQQELVKDPIVTVEFLNLGVSVLGEVNKPGRIPIDRDNMTILDAISQAGDLTIFGKRDKVVVLREQDGKQHSYTLNLCSASDVYSSPAYYLQQNDVVYVEPNGTKARQSTVNGNTVRSTSFWLSIGSFLMSAVLLIKNLK